MGNCSSNNNCNPCGPNFAAINQLANRAGAFARQANRASVDAQNAWLEFNALYLGAFAVAPTTDNEGEPLQVGALYWNSAGSQLYAWNGIAWVATNFNEFTPFLSTGSTTQRNLVTRTSDVKNVKDFGAVGNGIADDTAAIQATINAVALNPNGGTVFIPVGTYLVTGTLNIQSNGIVIQGVSTTGSTILFDNVAQDSFYLQGLSAPGIYNCQINDITLEHTGKTGGAAIRMYRANQCQFARLNINNCWNAFDIKTTNNIIISEVVAAQINGAFGCKWWSLGDGSERADVLTLENTVFDLASNGGDGIVWDGFAHTLRIVSVGILSANYGIKVLNTATSPSYYPAFGEFFDLEIDGTLGISASIQGGSVIAFNGCELFNLSTATGPILEIIADIGGSETNAIRIANSRILGGGEEAAVISGKNIIIVGSQIGGGSNTGFDCIKINDNTQDFIISSCQIGTSWGTPINKYSYGISLAANTFRGLINFNSFYGCLEEINNLSTTQTVYIDKYLNRVGTPNDPNLILRRSDNNTGVFEQNLLNTSSGASVESKNTLTTGTVGSFVSASLSDNSGSPFFKTSGGPAVTSSFTDFNTHSFRTNAGVVQFTIGSALGNFANDAAAAAGGVPLYGYYRNVNSVQQRIA